ncbi:MAG: glycerate kinase [Candidatus Promineifilaceae bacterium]
MIPPEFVAYRTHVNQIVTATITAAQPEHVIRRNVRREGRFLLLPNFTYPLDSGRLFVVSVGKAAIAMAQTVARIMGPYAGKGLVISKPAAAHLPPGYSYYQGGHPIPSMQSIRAAQATVRFLSTTQPADIVLCLISGGASALLTNPVIPLATWQALNEALLRSGCTIHDINLIRQHLDPIKGGGLAALAAPAACVALILSDIIGNPIELIGSGPTVPTSRHRMQALTLLEQSGALRHLGQAAATSVREHILQETPTITSPLHNHIVGDINLAAQAACQAAQAMGFTAQVLTTHLEGEAREAGKFAAAVAKNSGAYHCWIMGGETTVTVRGSGVGGRNQELALAAAIALNGWDQRVVASVATDAEDGPTPVAGAMVTGDTLAAAAALGVKGSTFLANNDSYRFFQAVGDGHIQAEQGTNVNDLTLVLAYAV